MGSCFAQGNSCGVGPPVQQLNEEGELARLNLSYYYSGFFDFSKGFDENQLADALMLVPRPVAEQLDEWFRKRLQPTQDHTRKYFPSVFWRAPTFLCLWPLYYAERRDRVRKWNEEMLKWQEEINREVFVPNGMFLKTQSERPYTLCGRFATKRWFAIAMNPKEAKARATRLWENEVCRMFVPCGERSTARR